MEKIDSNGTPESQLFVTLSSPQDLRMIADRIENQIREATLPGQLITYQLTKSIVLMVDPLITRSQIESRVE